MPRVKHILETALYCDDLARTAAFYQTLLDTAPMLTSERLIALDAGGETVLLLFQRGQTGERESEGGLVPAHDGAGPVHIAFAIDAGELESWARRVRDLQIPVESRVAWERGGTSLYFRDPDNRSVELATPGIWPIY